MPKAERTGVRTLGVSVSVEGDQTRRPEPRKSHSGSWPKPRILHPTRPCLSTWGVILALVEFTGSPTSGLAPIHHCSPGYPHPSFQEHAACMVSMGASVYRPADEVHRSYNVLTVSAQEKSAEVPSWPDKGCATACVDRDLSLALERNKPEEQASEQRDPVHAGRRLARTTWSLQIACNNTPIHDALLGEHPRISQGPRQRTPRGIAGKKPRV